MTDAKLKIEITAEDFPLDEKKYEMLGFLLKLSLRQCIISALDKMEDLPETLNIDTSISYKYPEIPKLLN